MSLAISTVPARRMRQEAVSLFDDVRIGNPDLVRPRREGATVADFDRKTRYTPGPKGWIDYPTLD